MRTLFKRDKKITKSMYLKHVASKITDEDIQFFYNYQLYRFSNKFGITFAQFYGSDPGDIQTSFIMIYEYILRPFKERNIYIDVPYLNKNDHVREFEFLDEIFEDVLQYKFNINKPYREFILDFRNDFFKRNVITTIDNKYRRYKL